MGKTPVEPTSVNAATKRKIKILIADDCKDIREVFSAALLDRGFEVVLASDGREAVARARRVLPDVIIMDMAMPTTDGWEAARLLKADARTASTPIVIMSAGAYGTIPPAMMQNCDGFLTKPCEPDEIIAEIARVLKNAALNLFLPAA